MNGERSAAFAGLRRAEEVRDQRSDRDSQLSTLNPQPSLELRIEESCCMDSRRAIGTRSATLSSRS